MSWVTPSLILYLEENNEVKSEIQGSDNKMD